MGTEKESDFPGDTQKGHLTPAVHYVALFHALFQILSCTQFEVVFERELLNPGDHGLRQLIMTVERERPGPHRTRGLRLDHVASALLPYRCSWEARLGQGFQDRWRDWEKAGGPTRAWGVSGQGQ